MSTPSSGTSSSQYHRLLTSWGRVVAPLLNRPSPGVVMLWSDTCTPPPNGLRESCSPQAPALHPRRVPRHAPHARLRLAGRRVRVRRERVGAAAAREGLLGRRARVRAAVRRRRVPEIHVGSAQLL